MAYSFRLDVSDIWDPEDALLVKPRYSQWTPIDYQKIVVVYNSDRSASETNADTYISLRGLNAAHKYPIAMGTSKSSFNPPWPYVPGSPSTQCLPNWVNDFADYLTAYGIEGIVVSTHCPWRVQAYDSGGSLKEASLLQILGGALCRQILDTTGSLDSDQLLLEDPSLEDGTTSVEFRFWAPTEFSDYPDTDPYTRDGAGANEASEDEGWYIPKIELHRDYLNAVTPKNAGFRPCGRLGVTMGGDFSDNSFDGDEDNVNIAQIVTRAIKAERHLEEAINEGQKYFVGLNNRTTDIHPGVQYLTYNLFSLLGFQMVYGRFQAIGHRPGVEMPESGAVITDETDIRAGTLTPPLRLNGGWGGLLANATTCGPSFDFLCGAWWIENTSYGHAVAASMIEQGKAVAGFGSPIEPLSQGFSVMTMRLLVPLLYGMSFMETMEVAPIFPYKGDWNIGDPLYSPFKRSTAQCEMKEFDEVSTCRYFWDASKTSTITHSSGDVTAWASAGGTGGTAWDLSSTGTGDSVRTGDVALNGNNVLDFRQAQYLQGPAGGAMTSHTTIVALVKHDVSGTTQFYADGASAALNRMGYKNTTSSFRFFSGTNYDYTAVLDDADWHVVMACWSSSGLEKFSVDGYPVEEASTGSTLPNGLTLGAGFNGAGKFNGKIAFIGVFEEDLFANDTDRGKIHDLIACRFGVDKRPGGRVVENLNVGFGVEI